MSEPPPLPAMSGLLSLGPSGPFPHASQAAWYFDPRGHVRYLDMEGYLAGQLEAGVPRHVAEDTVARMRAHGAGRVLWAAAHGGKRGHAFVGWDVRVATTGMPAAEAVPAILAMGGIPLGATAVRQLEGRTGVLVAYTQPVEPQTIRLPASRGPRWSRAFGVPARIESHFTRAAFASLAIGHVGATINLSTESLTTAEQGLRTLVDVVLADLDTSAG